MENHAKIRVRYAPSPTGRLHVGGVRTALFNWLFARKNGGPFVLRIEDTDLERSTEESVEQLGRSMRWIGLDWDEGPGAGGLHPPYRQTERFDLYREAAKKLLDSGAAYYDFATPEELAELRERARAEGRQPIYTGGEYREMDPDETRERIESGEPYTVRFKTPREGQTVVEDMIRGPVTFENSNLEDFVLMKSTDTPTYNFAAAFDDAEMEISHVIRGDDHLSNTPRQILIHQALGNTLPAFAHVPMVLGPDKKKLSKRHGAAHVEEFAAQGYLPEALFNYLALLGAGYAADEEIFSPAELAAVAAPMLAESGAASPAELERDLLRLIEIMALLRERLNRITEIPDAVGYFFGGKLDYDEGEFEKQFGKEFVRETSPGVVQCRKALPEWTEEAIEEAVRSLASEKGKGARHLIHPLRFAVTGRTVSAGLFETMHLLGRDRCLLRAEDAAQKIERLPVG